MDKLIHGTVITAASALLLALVTFSSAMPMNNLMEKAGYNVSWNEKHHTVTIEKQLDKEALSTIATITKVGNGYMLAQTEKLGTICFVFDGKTIISNGSSSDLYPGKSIKIYFDDLLTSTSTPQSYAREVVII